MFVFFLMIRRPPRSTLDRSSAASDVYKRQAHATGEFGVQAMDQGFEGLAAIGEPHGLLGRPGAVSYTHLRAHETVLDLVCRLLLEIKKQQKKRKKQKKLDKQKRRQPTIVCEATAEYILP